MQEKQGHAAVRRGDQDRRRRGQALPWDGKTFGRLKVRGPAVARAYFRDEAEVLDAEGFSIPATSPISTPHGYMRITDRSKDVIKSGGEWISSIELENLAVGHPDVAEAAVIGVHHAKWDERPLLIVVAKKRRVADQGVAARLPAPEGRQMVAARRRGVRRRDPAHRDRQDQEDGIARTFPRLSLAGRLRRGDISAASESANAADATKHHGPAFAGRGLGAH